MHFKKHFFSRFPAHAAGMRVIAITTTNPRATLQSAGADRIIDSFAELA